MVFLYSYWLCLALLQVCNSNQYELMLWLQKRRCPSHGERSCGNVQVLSSRRHCCCPSCILELYKNIYMPMLFFLQSAYFEFVTIAVHSTILFLPIVPKVDLQIHINRGLPRVNVDGRKVLVRLFGR